ncbi:MAG TPA: RsmD family RNA methyltransferase [Thermoleophilia bacterium]|nr:RsmD family RNA methyltransferase [Thermoleophilia bacterium]
MRVVAGQWRGRPLMAPSGRATRPTSDKVREAMFDVLAALPEADAARRHDVDPGQLSGHVVLDLFAGSGGLGIEALSRGAARCTFVERDRAALRALHGNLERLGIGVAAADRRSRTLPPDQEPRVRVLGVDVRRALSADALRGSRYTLLFVDPPYERYLGLQPSLLRLLGPLLAQGAVIVIETAVRTIVDLPWKVVREKRYGDTKIAFLVADDLRDAQGAADDDGEPI